MSTTSAKVAPGIFTCKGENIPLNPSQLWLVSKGLVKLSTIGESGEEVLVGLVGASMLFGSSLTSLPTYQATALSEDVELASISLAAIAASPRLSQALLPQITGRLKQTEALLAVSGKRQVKERLHYLLEWLKQEFSQTTTKGTRLSVRLTHQEIADACCSTRATITRQLSKLQKQGKIIYDSEQHIIFLEPEQNEADASELRLLEIFQANARINSFEEQIG